MRRVVFSFVFSMLAMLAFSQDFHSVGSNAKFCAYYFDGKYYLILSFEDNDDYKLPLQPVIKFQLNDGTIMKLEGYSSHKQSSEIHFFFKISSSSSEPDKRYFIIPITPEQIEQLDIGVHKVAINTIPRVLKKESWSGKKTFGHSLYVDFFNLTGDFDEFIDKF